MQVVVADVGNSSVKYLAGEIDGEQPRFQPAWNHCRSLDPKALSSSQPALLERTAIWYVSSVNAEYLGRLPTPALIGESLRARDMSRFHQPFVSELVT